MKAILLDDHPFDLERASTRSPKAGEVVELMTLVLSKSFGSTSRACSVSGPARDRCVTGS